MKHIHIVNYGTWKENSQGRNTTIGKTVAIITNYSTWLHGRVLYKKQE